MSATGVGVVVIDTMAVSALVNATRNPQRAAVYRQLIAGRAVLVSFATVAELRFGAIKAGWGELRCRALERDLAQLTAVQPDDELITVCAQLRADSEQAGLALGQKVHEADRWIAATAIRLEVPLVSADSVFGDVPGLVLERPSPNADPGPTTT